MKKAQMISAGWTGNHRQDLEYTRNLMLEHFATPATQDPRRVKKPVVILKIKTRRRRSIPASWEESPDRTTLSRRTEGYNLPMFQV
jgi:pyocin large subunit-like protein